MTAYRAAIGFRLRAGLLCAGLAACALASPRPAAGFAGNAGASGAQFLRLGVGARALGLGEAYGPVADGAEALYWNPAGLARLKRPAAAYSHATLWGSAHQDFAAYAHPFPRFAAAAGATAFWQDSLAAVTNANQEAGSFRPHSEAFALGLATDLHLDPDLFGPETGEHTPTSVGLALKFVTETLHSHTATAVAADAGILHHPRSIDAVTLSASFRNLGQSQRFVNAKASMPFEASFGAAWRPAAARGRGWLVAAEGAVPQFGPAYGKAGVEHSAPMGRWRGALRLGYKSLTVSGLGPLSGVTFGLGAASAAFSADFAFQPLGALGESFRLGLSYRFDAPGPSQK